MAVEVVRSNRARERLLAIYGAIGREDPSAAERVDDRIEPRVPRLADQPRMGPRRPDIRPSARTLSEPPYLILYETVPDADEGPVDRVEIVAVVDGRRDLDAGIA